MALLQTDARLFGLDLSTLWPDAKAAGAAMLSWPVLSWLTPKPPVRLIRADGTVTSLSCRSNAKTNATGNAKKANAAQQRHRFCAVQLPEDMLLRHEVVLPMLPPAAAQSAIALEAQRLSPFAPAATVWTCFPADTANAKSGTALSHRPWVVVITSRDLVQAHLQSLQAQLTGVELPKLEMWVSKTPQEVVSATAGHRDTEGAYTRIPGFGEAYRRQRQRWGRRVNMVLLAVAMLLLAAIAVTPTLQLRLRAVDAQQKFQALQQTVAPLQQQREAMVQAQTQLQSIAKIAGQPTSALKLINALTTAIPDDTYLQSLQIDAGDAAAKAPKVTIMGQTGNAAALMQHLGQQPGVQNVKAPSPAVRPLGAPKETFTIEMMVDLSALEGSATPAANQPAPNAPAAPAANTSVFGR